MINDLNDRTGGLSEDIRSQALDLGVDTFLALIYIADLVNRYVDVALEEGASRTELALLHTLVLNNGSMNVGEIGKKVFRSPHAITNAIDNLEKRGCVKRDLVDGDRRIRKVQITRLGLDLVRQSVPKRKALSAQAMACLDQAQMEELRSILRVLTPHLRRELNGLLVGRNAGDSGDFVP